MKKIILWLCCFSMLCMCFSPFGFAVESTDTATASEDATIEDAVTFSCYFNHEQSTVEINGTTHHNTMVSNPDSTLVVYALKPGTQVGDLASTSIMPVAQSSITIKFHFSVSVDSFFEQYSRYAVFLRSPDGVLTLASDPKYPTVVSSSEDTDKKTYYKGLSVSNASLTTELTPARSIIPVYLNRLFSASSDGLLYQTGDRILRFEADYVEELDVQIRSASAVGSRVYLQFLLSPGASDMALADSTDSGAKYDFPNLKDESVLQKIEAASGFLAKRYSDKQAGMLHGIIVGAGIDTPNIYQYIGDLSTDSYIELYTLYLIAVSNGARVHNPAIEIVLPFTDLNSYTRMHFDDILTPSDMLEGVLQEMERSISGEFSIKTLIETSTVPLGISNSTLQNGIDHTAKKNFGWISAEYTSDYSTYLAKLQDEYKYAPADFMFVWSVPNTLSGNALSCAYAYTYFLLLSDPMLSSFTVKLSDHPTAISDLKQIIKYIDTADSLEITKQLLPYFGINRWADILSIGGYDRRDAYSGITMTELPNTCIGSFVYEDFSSSFELSQWFRGEGCALIKSEGSTLLGTRAAKFKMTSQANHELYSEALCLYEFEESFAYTPYLSFAVTPEDESMSGIYEIKITVGNGADSLEASYALRAGQSQALILDLRCFDESFRAAYIRISARRLSQGAEDFTVWLQDITGYSDRYYSEELESLITEERLNIRNEALPQEDTSANRLVWIIFAILLVTGSIAVGVFIWLYRSDKSNGSSTES